MNSGIGARLKRFAKVLATLCAIEMVLPGGTVIVVTYFLTCRCHVRGLAEADRALKAWRGFGGRISASTGGGSSLADSDSAEPVAANRPAAIDGPPLAGEV